MTQTKKDPDYYEDLKEKYQGFIVDNKLLAVPSVMETVNTKTFSLLTTNVKSKRCIDINREGMEEALILK